MSTTHYQQDIGFGWCSIVVCMLTRLVLGGPYRIAVMLPAAPIPSKDLHQYFWALATLWSGFGRQTPFPRKSQGKCMGTTFREKMT